MTRILSSACFLLAVMAALVSAVAVDTSDAGVAGAITTTGTPLPPAWELCVLAGVGAPATQDNISDLDEWQVAEGGSTNNTAAYNPFNTTRTTNALGAPLPVTSETGGFPAFPDWLTGCSATVATLLQPNMWNITAALRTGSVAPPGAFLVDVDGSAWCAPSASGQPCYENAIAAAGGVPALVEASSALDVFSNVQSDLHAYQLSLVTAAGQLNAKAAKATEVARAQEGLTAARAQYAKLKHQLGTFAVSEYVHSGLYQATDLGTGSALPSATSSAAVAQEYSSIAAGDLVSHVQSAADAVSSAQAALAAADRGLQNATAELLADDAAESHALKKLADDLSTLQTAGTCTTVSIVDAPSPASTSGTGASSPAGGSATSTSSSTSTTTTQGATGSTTTSSAPPTTTTSTAPPTTTTTVSGSSAPNDTSTAPSGLEASTTTSSTVGTTTTTTSATTTTTQAASARASGTSPTGSGQANPAGIGALQGCVSALEPAGRA